MMQRIICGDALEELRKLPDESVHCCVTSPPYWGLRDYGTASWEGGDGECDHVETQSLKRDSSGGFPPAGEGTRGTQSATRSSTILYRDVCAKCGARRIDKQLGLESTPGEYLERMTAVFREVRRVLRADGTCWVNMGDGYQEKQLVGMPWRLAFALQADGWYLRGDIIWHKPNPMPESITDRPTKAHEYVFLLTKAARYFYDADAIREADSGQAHDRHVFTGAPSLEPSGGLKNPHGSGLWQTADANGNGRNARDVWTIATQAFSDAHFAVFPEKLAEKCIRAGTSEKGACPECGAPWVRVVERGDLQYQQKYEYRQKTRKRDTRETKDKGWSDEEGFAYNAFYPRTTTGWKPTCECNAGDPVPCTVLDPFGGACTTALVATKLNRGYVMIELNPEYVDMARRRLRDRMGLFAEVGT